ncbi:MAG TPA: hypothetical protein VF157_11590 [Chloroflexota bacterium]
MQVAAAALMSEVAIGALAGLMASVPQVLVTQAVEKLLGLPPRHADIGPRFVQRLAERLEAPLSPAGHWLLAGVFHFAYAAAWGALYGAVQRRVHVPASAGGVTMAVTIYTLAFSRLGAATQAGSEPHPERRRRREFALHWTPALTFSLLTAYGYEWLRRRVSTR